MQRGVAARAHALLHKKVVLDALKLQKPQLAVCMRRHCGQFVDNIWSRLLLPLSDPRGDGGFIPETAAGDGHENMSLRSL